PPTNHLACGSSQSRTLSNGLIHSRLAACSAQKPAGSACAFWKRRSYSAGDLTWACAENAAGGGNERVSLRTLVMCEVGEDMTSSDGRAPDTLLPGGSKGKYKRGGGRREGASRCPLPRPC